MKTAPPARLPAPKIPRRRPRPEPPGATEVTRTVLPHKANSACCQLLRRCHGACHVPKLEGKATGNRPGKACLGAYKKLDGTGLRFGQACSKCISAIIRIMEP